MQDIQVTVLKTREVRTCQKTIGNENEHRVTKLVFDFPAELEEYTKYIEFDIKGEKIFDLIENDEYVLNADVVQYKEIRCQLVFENSETEAIWKSNMFRFSVRQSINAKKKFNPGDKTNVLNTITVKLSELEHRVSWLEDFGVGGGGGDYERLMNLPTINDVPLIGNRKLPERPLTNLEILEIWS